ncbi:MAG: ECF transporter S component [Christensenellales bacterium]|jgi:hypothetical protein
MSKAKKLTNIAAMAAIGLVINLVSAKSFPAIGRPSLVYGFCYISGIVIGPVNGMIAAIISDIAGYFLSPIEAPYVPQITLANGLMALTSGLLYKHLKFKRKELSIIVTALICFPLLTLGLAAWGEAVILLDLKPNWYVLALSMGEKTGIKNKFLMVAMQKAITQPVWIALNVLIAVPFVKRLSKIKQHFIESLLSFKAEIDGSKEKNPPSPTDDNCA